MVFPPSLLRSGSFDKWSTHRIESEKFEMEKQMENLGAHLHNLQHEESSDDIITYPEIDFSPDEDVGDTPKINPEVVLQKRFLITPTSIDHWKRGDLLNLADEMSEELTKLKRKLSGEYGDEIALNGQSFEKKNDSNNPPTLSVLQERETGKRKQGKLITNK